MALARWERGLNDVSQHPAILAALRSSSRFRRRVPASGWCTCSTTARPLTCGDRKSTRLNSSHVEISYAVFCLKKKKLRRGLLCPKLHKKKNDLDEQFFEEG